MKTTWVLLAAVAAWTQSANADFSCKSRCAGTLELLEPSPGVTRAYTVKLTNLAGEVKTFGALPTAIDESDLYSKFEYKLWNAEHADAHLTIVERVNMGRGGPIGTTINGKLKLGATGVQTDFTCEEVDL